MGWGRRQRFNRFVLATPSLISYNVPGVQLTAEGSSTALNAEPPASVGITVLCMIASCFIQCSDKQALNIHARSQLVLQTSPNVKKEEFEAELEDLITKATGDDTDLRGAFTIQHPSAQKPSYEVLITERVGNTGSP